MILTGLPATGHVLGVRLRELVTLRSVLPCSTNRLYLEGALDLLAQVQQWTNPVLIVRCNSFLDHLNHTIGLEPYNKLLPLQYPLQFYLRASCRIECYHQLGRNHMLRRILEPCLQSLHGLGVIMQPFLGQRILRICQQLRAHGAFLRF